MTKPLTPEELDQLEQSLTPLLRPVFAQLIATVRAAWAERDEARDMNRRLVVEPFQHGRSVGFSAGRNAGLEAAAKVLDTAAVQYSRENDWWPDGQEAAKQAAQAIRAQKKDTEQ